ncbi:hypothetical protein [Lacticaseibacillus sharpeae]|nr:hypothetical protein [Lacticaseibacillus sharpeae]
MRNSMMYVRFEPISTAFVTMGIEPVDMLNTANANPQHILVLPPVTDDLTINAHTGFNVIDGGVAVRQFLESVPGRNAAWLDYREQDFVNDLLPQEIAELLYLGHRKTHMALPFYYKLQNQYARVPMATGLVNSYWRHPEMFEAVFSAAINRHLRDLLNQQAFWLRMHRHEKLPQLPSSVQKSWQDMLPDGVGFDWNSAKVSGQTVIIPLVQISERRLFVDADINDVPSVKVGQLVLNRATGVWHSMLS